MFLGNVAVVDIVGHMVNVGRSSMSLKLLTSYVWKRGKQEHDYTFHLMMINISIQCKANS